MIWTALTTAAAFLKRVPWQVWLVIAVLLSAWLWGNHRYSQGIHDERARWEAAAAKAKSRADKASADAAQQRIEDIVHNIDQQREREDAIEQAVPAGARLPLLMPLIALSLVSACDRPVSTPLPPKQDVEAATERKPVPPDDIATSAAANARYSADVESWGDRVRSAGVRVCKWLNQASKDADYNCGG